MNITFNDCKSGVVFDGTDDIYIFCCERGKLTENAQDEFVKAFAEDTSIVLSYGDEGYPTAIPWYKPDFSPDTLESFFYIGNVFAIKGDAIGKITGDINIYEMVLQLAKKGKFYHIPKVLYINDSDEESRNLPGYSKTGSYGNKDLMHGCMVSIVIPSKDNSRVLERCISSITENTTSVDYEIIVVDNGSSQSERLCITSIVEKYRCRYIYEKRPFNFSYMCNVGAKEAKGHMLLFLNDDTEAVDANWLNNMLLSATRDHVGAVGAKLFYPDYHIQHVGITNMGVGPVHKSGEYHGHNDVNYNMIAVTGACMMVKRELFDRIGRFDESFPIAYNDVELCFRLYKAGYYNVVRNDSVLIHHESLSRGSDEADDKKKRLISEKQRLYGKHPDMWAYDPFYSPNLVQWKWDGEYNENVIHEYDKQVTPVILSNEEVKKLPKVHNNKCVRKLTGENLLMFNIDGIDFVDGIENMYRKNMVLVRGWVVLKDKDNSQEKCKKQLLLKSADDEGIIYKLTIHPQQRDDVADLFDEKTKFAQNTGINVFFDEKALPKGKYVVGVLMENNRRFVKWSTETIERLV